MENQGKKTELLNASCRDVLWDSVINDISGENVDSARTERLIEKINRLCKCAACFLCIRENLSDDRTDCDTF
jgi:hypothetical protein